MLNDEEIRQLVQKENPPGPPGSGYRLGASLCALAALGLGAFGIYRMFDLDSSGRLVGGDAYNYIILTNRGVGLICSAVLVMLLSCLLMLLSIEERLVSKK